MAHNKRKKRPDEKKLYVHWNAVCDDAQTIKGRGFMNALAQKINVLSNDVKIIAPTDSFITKSTLADIATDSVPLDEELPQIFIKKGTFREAWQKMGASSQKKRISNFANSHTTTITKALQHLPA